MTCERWFRDMKYKKKIFFSTRVPFHRINFPRIPFHYAAIHSTQFSNVVMSAIIINKNNLLKHGQIPSKAGKLLLVYCQIDQYIVSNCQYIAYNMNKNQLICQIIHKTCYISFQCSVLIIYLTYLLLNAVILFNRKKRDNSISEGMYK